MPSPPSAPNERVAHGAALDALRRVLELSGDPALGLHVAANLERGAMDLLEYLARSCETVREGIETISRYSRLLHDALEFELKEVGDDAVWSLGVASGLPWHPAATDFITSVLVRGLREATDGRLQPRELRFRQASPEYRGEYDAFGCALRFGSDVDAVVFAREALDWPLASADPRLHRVLERQAMQVLDSLPLQQTFATRVAAQIRHVLGSSEPHVDPIARALGVSPRTLRRRLQEEGTSFGALLDHVRRDVALDQLSRPRASIPEIARGLGFSRIPSFYRAFKRWTGTTPAEYRQKPDES